MYKGYFTKYKFQNMFKDTLLNTNSQKCSWDTLLNTNSKQCSRDTLLNTNSPKMFMGYFIKYNPKEPMEDCGYIAVF